MVKVNKTNYSNHCESIRTITFVWSYLTQSVTVSCRWFFVFGKLHQWGLLCLPSWRVIFERHPVLQSERTIENWSDSTAACNRLCHGYILHTTESLSWRPLNVVDSCKQTSKRFAETFVIQKFMASCRLFGTPCCTVTWMLGNWWKRLIWRENAHSFFFCFAK